MHINKTGDCNQELLLSHCYGKVAYNRGGRLLRWIQWNPKKYDL